MKNQEKIDKIVEYFRSLREEVPTNSTGAAIPGTSPGEYPFVKKKEKKRYIYGGKGSRKHWMP